VLTRDDPDTGKRLEPLEEVTIDVDADFAGVVVEKLGERRADLIEMRPAGAGKQRLVFVAPSRSLIGYHGDFLTDTRGEGIMYQVFARYAPKAGEIRRRENGALIVLENCETVTYGLHNLQERGKLICGAGERVYAGQIIGLHSRGNDLVVNPGKKKQLTNMRAAGSDDALRLTPHWRPTLEQSIELIVDDELVEVTPKSIRIRKQTLDHGARRKEEKQRSEG
jgi:GTP-binding protein